MDVSAEAPSLAVAIAAVEKTGTKRRELCTAAPAHPQDDDYIQDQCCFKCGDDMPERGRYDLSHLSAAFPLLYSGCETAEFCTPTCAFAYCVRRIYSTRQDLVEALAEMFQREYPRYTFHEVCALCHRRVWDMRPPAFYDHCTLRLFCCAACFGASTGLTACSICNKPMDDSGAFSRDYHTQYKLVCSKECADRYN